MTRTSLVAAMMLGLTIGLPGPALAQGDDRDAETMIQHTIIVYQENISFDHYFGTFGHGSARIPGGAPGTTRSTTVPRAAYTARTPPTPNGWSRPPPIPSLIRTRPATFATTMAGRSCRSGTSPTSEKLPPSKG